MIEWLYPAALAGLLTTAGPILLHLLRRQRAERVLFPSLRFFRPSRTAAVRMRLPSDLGLLALRVAILATAALALSHPLLVSAGRQQEWNGRLARAIVVDTSRSMTALRAQVDETARAEERSAFRSVRIDAAQIQGGLRQALSELERLPPARREIVVVSDFQRGALSAGALEAVPAGIGLRLVPVERRRDASVFTGDRLLGAADVPAKTQTVRASEDWTALGLNPSPGGNQGLRVEAAPRDAEAVAALLRSVARTGAPAPSADEPIVIVFPDGATPARTAAIDRPWMIRTILRMAEDADLSQAAAESEPMTMTTPAGGATVVRDRSGKPLVTAVAAEGHLVLSVAALPSAFAAAAAVKSALDSRLASGRWAEEEVATIPREQLLAWSRPPGEASATDRTQRAPGDARWLWLTVLLLLAVEGFVRRRSAQTRQREAHANAA